MEAVDVESVCFHSLDLFFRFNKFHCGATFPHCNKPFVDRVRVRRGWGGGCEYSQSEETARLILF